MTPTIKAALRRNATRLEKSMDFAQLWQTVRGAVLALGAYSCRSPSAHRYFYHCRDTQAAADGHEYPRQPAQP
jgi:hypothetical protein